VPFGYLFTTALLALATWFALAPPRPRQSSPTNKSYWLGFLPNELPFVAFLLLLASTLLALAQGDLATPVGWVGFALAVLASVGLVIVVRRALRTGPVIDRALNEGLGTDWRSEIDPELATRLRRRLPLARILFAPILHRRRDVERVANISYGTAGKWNLLDVYRHRSHLTPNDPVFQPGFEHADTSVTASVSLYGFYGSPGTDWPRPSSPMAYVRADAPPFFVTHGDLDTVVVVEDARRFVAELRSTSANPVVYVELPGAHHSFDLFHSIRFETVVDGIEGFTAWVRSRATD
jgi:Prolyl oligopeptidase family